MIHKKSKIWNAIPQEYHSLIPELAKYLSHFTSSWIDEMLAVKPQQLEVLKQAGFPSLEQYYMNSPL